MSLAARAAAAALLQVADQLLAGGAERRGQAEQQAGAHRHDEGEGEYGVVEPDPLDHDRRDVVGDRGDQQPHPPERQTDAQGAAGQTQDHALGEQLAEHPAASSAQRGPHRHLATPALGPGEEQAGHVGAGDEQHEADRAHQDEDRRTDVTDERLGQGSKLGPGDLLAFLRFELPVDPVQVGLRHLHRHAVAQPPDRVGAL